MWSTDYEEKKSDERHYDFATRAKVKVGGQSCGVCKQDKALQTY